MFWLLIAVLFMQDGSVVALAQAEPTQRDCTDDIAILTASPKPDGAVAVGFKCDGPLSNPLASKSAEAQP